MGWFHFRVLLDHLLPCRTRVAEAGRSYESEDRARGVALLRWHRAPVGQPHPQSVRTAPDDDRRPRYVNADHRQARYVLAVHEVTLCYGAFALLSVSFIHCSYVQVLTFID